MRPPPSERCAVEQALTQPWGGGGPARTKKPPLRLQPSQEKGLFHKAGLREEVTRAICQLPTSGVNLRSNPVL